MFFGQMNPRTHILDNYSKKQKNFGVSDLSPEIFGG